VVPDPGPEWNRRRPGPEPASYGEREFFEYSDELLDDRGGPEEATAAEKRIIEIAQTARGAAMLILSEAARSGFIVRVDGTWDLAPEAKELAKVPRARTPGPRDAWSPARREAGRDAVGYRGRICRSRESRRRRSVEAIHRSLGARARRRQNTLQGNVFWPTPFRLPGGPDLPFFPATLTTSEPGVNPARSGSGTGQSIICLSSFRSPSPRDFGTVQECRGEFRGECASGRPCRDRKEFAEIHRLLEGAGLRIGI
jgi:hypothetical protein